jgi:hypothetical protein
MSLASSAAATVVTLLATDAWTQVRQEIGALWRRLRPDDADQAVTAEAAVTRDRAEIDAHVGADGPGPALRAEWEARFLRLVGADPAAARDLARVLRELDGLRDGRPGNVQQDATASGHGTVIQVGRDSGIGRLTVGRSE